MELINENKNINLTEDIKKSILNELVFKDENINKISLGNCRLDFKKTYDFIGFTKKGVILLEDNGTEKIKKIAKVYPFENEIFENEINRIEVRGYKLVAENWSFIERFGLKGIN